MSRFFLMRKSERGVSLRSRIIGHVDWKCIIRFSKHSDNRIVCYEEENTEYSLVLTDIYLNNPSIDIPLYIDDELKFNFTMDDLKFEDGKITLLDLKHVEDTIYAEPVFIRTNTAKIINMSATKEVKISILGEYDCMYDCTLDVEGISIPRANLVGGKRMCNQIEESFVEGDHSLNVYLVDGDRLQKVICIKYNDGPLQSIESDRLKYEDLFNGSDIRILINKTQKGVYFLHVHNM
jgi:hypothetical protein